MEKTKYYPEIKRYIVSRVRNPHDADDITQHVFLEFFRGNNDGINHQEAKLKLFGISKNLLAKYYQNKQGQPRLISIDVLEAECSIKRQKEAAEILRNQELKKILKASLKRLPAKDYKTIRLFLTGNYSLKEAAKRENISFDTFYKRYQRALKILRKIISEFGDDDF
ncbi:MAG: RNA polymerase sigma factor [Bacteroidales bacterium]|nr:RNA polymerase sigma factor [Bacteroidales bacterium]